MTSLVTLITAAFTYMGIDGAWNYYKHRDWDSFCEGFIGGSWAILTPFLYIVKRGGCRYEELLLFISSYGNTRGDINIYAGLG